MTLINTHYWPTTIRAILVVLIELVFLMSGSIAQGQWASEDHAIAFLQNAMLTKAGGDCGALNTTALTPVYTPYGAIGGGTMSFYSHLDYLIKTPMVNASGELMLSSLNSSHSMAPGALVGVSQSTYTTLSEETINLSHVSPNTITVVTGFCGTGVKFAGTDGGVIGTNNTRMRKMNGSVNGDVLQTRLQPPCTDKEVKKKDCSERTWSLTEETIFFPNNPDMATRFAAALQQLVIYKGGRPDAF